ncbi:MAG: DUF1848 family protein [Desulfobacterales bacterium]
MISASRRTDIPAFHMPWFMRGVERGGFEVEHPFSRRVRFIPIPAASVHTIVFWSKDFGPFLEGRYGERLEARGFHLYFQFTLNPADPVLEPGVPPLAERLAQLRELALRFGAACVNWRLDPICFYRLEENGRLRDNRGGMEPIADAAAAAGIRRCTTSFLDLYAKVGRRVAGMSGFSFVDPPTEVKVETILGLEALLCERGISLLTCCEAGLLERLPAASRIRAGACIPSEQLVALYGGSLSFARDPGQRRAQGCLCRVSVDIGSYGRQRCRHGCLYCYAI